MKPSPEITSVLNQLEALYLTSKVNGRSTFLSKLAHDLKVPYQRVYEWIVSRKHEPKASKFVQLNNNLFLIRIAMSDFEEVKYQKNLKRVSKERKS